jgi:tetratricopeptide (TPR) repeat protein
MRLIVSDFPGNQDFPHGIIKSPEIMMTILLKNGTSYDTNSTFDNFMTTKQTIRQRDKKPASVSGFVQSPQNQNCFLGLLLILGVFIAYQPAWHAGFIWDDDAHLTANPCIIGPLGFKQIWTSSSAVYYPLVLTSFWVEHALWGLNPMPYHLVNIATHAACGILLWRVLQCLIVRGAWLGAALWALHPVQTESVAWITELKNTQSCFFYLLAILCFLKWQSEKNSAKPQRTEWYYALALFCAALAILSKTSTVMLPVVLGLCWWWMEGRWQWGNILRLVPFLMISGVASGWTIWEQQFHSGALGSEWAQSWSERFIISGKDIWFYFDKLFWPHPLIFLYPHWQINVSQPVVYLPALAVIAVLLVLWLKRNGTLRPVFFAFAYFVVSLFPVLDFFHVYFFRYSFVGDHFQYLASIGPLALAAAGISVGMEFFKKRNPLLKPVICGVLLLTLAALTWRQSRMYTDIETLWRTTIAKNPNAFLAYNNLGSIFLQSGQVNEAMPYFQKALEGNPNFSEAHSNLGDALMRMGQVDEGLKQLKTAVEISPNSVESQYNLGRGLMQTGQMEEAMEHFQKVLAIQPNFAKADNNMGCILLRMQRLDEAADYFQKAIESDSGYAEAHYNLGGVFGMQGQFDEAVTEYKKAIEIKPDYTHAHNNLADVLAAQGKLDDAVQEYRRTLELSPNSAQAHYGLGLVLQKQNKLSEAIIEYQEALRLNPQLEPAKQQLRILGKSSQ